MQDKPKTEERKREALNGKRVELTHYEHPVLTDSGIIDKDMSELQEIKSYLASLMEHINDKQEESFMASEWKVLGLVIDRLMFWVCLVTVVVMCVVFIFDHGTSAEYPVYKD